MGGHRGQVGSHGSLLVLGVTLESQGSVWGQGVTWVTFGPRGHGGSHGVTGIKRGSQGEESQLVTGVIRLAVLNNMHQTDLKSPHKQQRYSRLKFSTLMVELTEIK